MASLLFEQLENAGYLRGRKVILKKILAAKPKDIIGLAEQSVELTSADDLEQQQPLFTHSVSISLGGGKMPCFVPDCRLKRARELAQFACLYNDKVYIHNFLQDFTSHPGHIRKRDAEWLHHNFATDLLVLAELRPIIEDGKLEVVGLPNACPSCLAQTTLSQDVRQRLIKASRKLEGRFRKEVAIVLEKRGNTYGLIAEGPEVLLDHGSQAWELGKLPPKLAHMKRLIARVNSGESVQLVGA